MIIALTGTPGTGKTSVSVLLEKNSYQIINLNDLAQEKDFLEGYDKKRDSKIVNIDKINEHIKKHKQPDQILILDAHISHLLKCVKKVFLLRCHPDELRKRLIKKDWKKNKIDENIEAEILDIILCETLEIHDKSDVFEIDTTKLKPKDVAEIIKQIIKNDFKHKVEYEIGHIDWSEEILKENKG